VVHTTLSDAGLKSVDVQEVSVTAAVQGQGGLYDRGHHSRCQCLVVGLGLGQGQGGGVTRGVSACLVQEADVAVGVQEVSVTAAVQDAGAGGGGVL
jgi:hypothetical protein